MKILIIGTGRVARELGSNLLGAGLQLAGVAGRDPDHTTILASLLGARAFTLGQELPEVDLVLIAVSDDAIASVAGQLDTRSQIVVHTSGASSMDLLHPHKHCGVLWPVQTFIAGTPVSLKEVPLIYEGNSEQAREALRTLAGKLSDRIIELAHAQRQVLHLAAVLTSNFPVMLVREAQRLMQKNGLDTDLLGPLWKTTAGNVVTLGPESALTGPARRKDHRTMKHHSEMLTGEPDLQKLYELLSRMIMERQ